MKYTITYLLVYLLPMALCGQHSNPDDGRIFTDQEIPQVHISINPDSLEILYQEENWYSNHEYPATFVWVDSEGADTLTDIGFRFRGNTARAKIKKSFKVSFNTFISGRRYYGLKKLNLNAETNDPSMLRSNAAWRMYRDHGVAASRSNHVEVYINGDYYGLYQNCEHINDDWVDERFGDDEGNLYKCSYPANLQYLSNNPDSYKLTPPWSDTRVYELKTNEELDDYSDLAAFIAYLNQASPSDFACGFDAHFNVYAYLKILAIDVLTGNWDGYLHNQNNFYLYHHPRTDRFEYLPYDLDNTWGIDWLGQDWTSRDIYAFGPGGFTVPLYERLMDDATYRHIFSWYIGHMAEDYLSAPEWESGLESLQNLIGPSALDDPYRPLDFGYSDADFLNALDQAFGDHVDYGVFPFAELRVANALEQLNAVEIGPIISEVREHFAAYPDSVRVRVYVDGPELSSLSLQYHSEGNEPQILTATGDGSPRYTFWLPVEGAEVEWSYNITATGTNGLTRNAWCADRVLDFSGAGPQIVINEVMASNSSTIADEHGDFDDWIELYNAGSVPVNLTSLYLSDKDGSPLYWDLPDYTMEPNTFLLVWADNQTWQGPFHARFAVSASGERLYLWQKRSTGLRLIDEIDVPATPTDVSYGRAVDAGLPWIFFDEPTPGASNHLLSQNEVDAPTRLRVYPNPTAEEVRWDALRDFELYDLSGRLLRRGNGSRLQLGPWSQGVYLLRLGDEWHRVVKE